MERIPPLNEQVNSQIDRKINEIPAPTQATITGVYTDNYVDVSTANYGKIRYVPCIGTPATGNDAVLIFLDNNLKTPIIITGG